MSLLYLENTILEAINRAIEIIEFNRREEKRAREFEAIINSVSDGILATNEKNKITLINHSAKKLLSLDGNMTGKDIGTFFTDKNQQIMLNKKLLNDEFVE